MPRDWNKIMNPTETSVTGNRDWGAITGQQPTKKAEASTGNLLKGKAIVDTEQEGFLGKIAGNPLLNAPGRFAENALNKVTFGLYPAPKPAETLPGKAVDIAGKFTGE